MKTKAPRVLFIFLVLIFFATNAYSNTFKCTRVVDGDTIVVDYHGKLEKVRLIGVDTPETVHPNKPVEYFGKEASNFTRTLVEGKNVNLEFDWQQRDRYGRLLAYVYLQDGTLLNKKIIEDGYGHAYTRFPFKYLDDFKEAERRARKAGQGLWGSSSNLTREEVQRVRSNKVAASDDAIAEASDDEIRDLMISRSIAAYPGNCPCPYNSDRAGRRCGGRSAYSRPGGYSPLCYRRDITDEMVAEFRARNQ